MGIIVYSLIFADVSHAVDHVNNMQDFSVVVLLCISLSKQLQLSHIGCSNIVVDNRTRQRVTGKVGITLSQCARGYAISTATDIYYM